MAFIERMMVQYSLHPLKRLEDDFPFQFGDFGFHVSFRGSIHILRQWLQYRVLFGV